MQRFLRYEYLYLYPLLLSAILSLKTFGPKWPKQYKLFGVLVMVSLLTEALANFWIIRLHNLFGWDYSKNNLWIYNLFITVRLVLLQAIYYLLLHNPRIKRMIAVSAPILILFGLINYFFIQGPFQSNTYTVITSHVTIITLCLYYFRQLLQDPYIIVLHKEPMIWMTLGTFLYQTASLPFLVMFGFLNMYHSPLALSFLFINDTFNFLMCICYLISFLCKPQHPQPL
ncbi:hypothetical protein [Chitinophaga agri]|uniref:Uncharacterized protein n=1 Tax=Chitinophaga agri TaxID=2703787 RepID=A0A6B9ZKC8_9BACT|nr:hypothetical protein [Chitinophaga agri]QHS62387.1 hypothetical protein GWR21_23205 [Chitinophaga agri]